MKELAGPGRLAHVGDAALGHEKETVELLEYLARRLMYGAHDRLAHAARHALHAVHYGHGHERVEAARRLVAEQNGRIDEQLGGEGQATPLAARYARYVNRADQRVLALF